MYCCSPRGSPYVNISAQGIPRGIVPSSNIQETQVVADEDINMGDTDAFENIPTRGMTYARGASEDIDMRDMSSLPPSVEQ